MDAMMALAKAYINSLSSKEELLNLLDKLLLSENEFTVLKSVYYDHNSLGFVADETGYSLQNIKIIHKKALLKVANFILRKVNM